MGAAKKEKSSFGLRLAASLVVGIPFSVLLLRQVVYSEVEAEALLKLALVLIPAYLMFALTHELGHFVFGMLAGLEPIAFQVGPVMIKRTPKGYSVHYAPTWQKMGGQVIMAPTKSLQSSFRPFVAFVAGGPIATAITTIVCLPLALHPLVPGSERDFLLSTSGILFCFLGCFMLAFNLLPITWAGFELDGLLLKNLLRKNEAARRFLASAAITGCSNLGIRPREYPPDALTDLLLDCDTNPNIGLALTLVAYHHLDSGQCTEALRFMEEAFTHSTTDQPLYTSLALELCAVRARCGGDLVEARSLFDQVKSGKVFFPFLPHRTEAAILLAESNLKEARKKLSAAQELFDGDRNIADYMFLMDRDWMKEISRRIDEGLLSTSSSPKQLPEHA